MTHIFVSNRGSQRLMVGLALAILAGLLVAQVAWADHETGQMSEAARQQAIAADAAKLDSQGRVLRRPERF